MECNKEEAIRAKGIAENKMQNKDFAGAKKIILKAQQLFPELDNVTQMLTVCQVHISAGAMVNGEMDWYGILQLGLTADDPSIKKQYRKLALLLHPDKNKFAGAEAAFKLIGEAHMTLSDRGKRSLHDMKRKSNVMSKQPSQPTNRNTHARKQPAVPSAFSNTTTYRFGGINPQQQHQARTFWTICTYCHMRYQYFREIINRALVCPSCGRSFIAAEMIPQPPPDVNLSHQWNQTQIPKQEVPSQQTRFGNSSNTGFQGNVAGAPTSMGPCPTFKTNTAHDIGGSASKGKGDGVACEEGAAASKVQSEKVIHEELKKKEQQGKPSAVNVKKEQQAKPSAVNVKKEQQAKPSAANAKRKKDSKVVLESSDSDSESSTDSEDIVIEDDGNPLGQNAGPRSSRYPRRSSRPKQNVTYNEDRSEDDDDFVTPPKRSRKSEPSGNTDCKQPFSGNVDGAPNNTCEDITNEKKFPNGDQSMNINKMHGWQQAAKQKETSKPGTCSNANSTVDSSPKASPCPGSFSCPDNEFYDFNVERDPRKFQVGQIWAAYDDLDGMPRYYARIREVHIQKFKLRYTWLEYKAKSDSEEAWIDEDLPVACGNFRLGKSESVESLDMFSHIVLWKKGTMKNTYDVYPMKGEVWAIFKDWDAGWSCDADSHRLYEYEVVQVVSDFSDGDGVCVIHLVKVKGFLSLFVRANRTCRIPPSEVLRFSHKVPCYRLTGKEGIPEGAYELDTASLPNNMTENFPSISLNDAASYAVKLDDNCNDPFFISEAGEEKPATCSINKDTIDLTEEVENTESGGFSRKSVNGAAKNLNNNAYVAAEHRSSSLRSPSPSIYEYPQTEFHDFLDDRSIGKFQQEQIWALYSDVDKYPKYYAKIKKVKESRVSVSWLELCPQQEDEVMWSKKGLPSACGRFKVERMKGGTFDIDTFSHLVHAVPSGKRNEYDIYPRSGEVWALYKNWSLGWTHADLDKCEYDVVQVIEQPDSVVRVLFLTKVDEYNAIFRPDARGGVEQTAEIPMDDARLRFSHQIPAFRLCDAEWGMLQGYWELDSASLPDM